MLYKEIICNNRRQGLQPLTGLANCKFNQVN